MTGLKSLKVGLGLTAVAAGATALLILTWSRGNASFVRTAGDRNGQS